MNAHKHARLAPYGRALLVQRIEDGQRVEEAAQAAGVSVRTAYKWLKRYREEGDAGLQDRSSRPRRSPRALSIEQVRQLTERRRDRATYRQIHQELGLGLSTIARWLQRAGLNRLSQLSPAPPILRYEYSEPGGLLHLDIKKRGRFHQPGHRLTGDRRRGSDGADWEYVHVTIDDASRVAHSSLRPDESAASAWRALLAALRYYRRLGVRFTRVLTDNGVCYRSGTPSAGSCDACACVICARSPTPHAPTARPSASSRPRCASGPTRAATNPPASGPTLCHSGCISTTGTVPMPASTTSRRSAASLFQ